MSELKACPFCGGTNLAIACEETGPRDKAAVYGVVCQNRDCNNHLHMNIGGSTFNAHAAHATRLWNTRPAHERHNEALRLRPIDSLPNEDGRVVLLVQGNEVFSVICNAGDIMKGRPYYTWTPRDERSMMLGTVAVDVFDGWLDPREVAALAEQAAPVKEGG